MKKLLSLILLILSFYTKAQRPVFFNVNNQFNFVPQPISAPIATSGLVLFLDAGNVSSYTGTGTTWTDLSGSNNNATLVNSPVYSSSNQGSLQFNGVNNYGVINPATSMIFGSSNFTISWWQYITTVLDARLFGNLPNGSWGTNDWVMAQNAGGANTLGFYIRNYSTGPILTATTTVQTWQNIVIIRSGNVWSLYLNNNLISSVTASVSMDGGVARYFYIASSGSFSADRNWGGNVANLLIYNRAITNTEQLQNYNTMKVRFGL